MLKETLACLLPGFIASAISPVPVTNSQLKESSLRVKVNDSLRLLSINELNPLSLKDPTL